MFVPIQNIISAFFASVASTFGKFAFDFNEGSFASNTVATLAKVTGLPPSIAVYGVRAVFLLFLIVANSMMLKFYVESMRKYSALQATMFNFSFNFLFSALSGMIVFGEILTMKWWFGQSLMIIGVVLASTGKQSEENKLKKE
eukprot:GDKJ01039365.1.p1 GENE.GDKJ01039365.1~~GDKJ01039365.1.p1  ORF type:complete len:143 (-),score=23.80 GDKJ01039365.1:22-450(-)